MGVEVDGLVGLDGERHAQVGDEGDVKCRSPLLFEHKQVGDERVDDVAVVVFEGDDYGRAPWLMRRISPISSSGISIEKISPVLLSWQGPRRGVRPRRR